MILIDPDGSISDIVRFFNNLIDTGGGTGLGDQVFMYSKLNLPISVSVNAVRIAEAPVGQPTIYVGNGTVYSIYSDVIPEPSSLSFMLGGLAGNGPGQPGFGSICLFGVFVAKLAWRRFRDAAGKAGGGSRNAECVFEGEAGDRTVGVAVPGYTERVRVDPQPRVLT